MPKIVSSARGRRRRECPLLFSCGAVGCVAANDRSNDRSSWARKSSDTKCHFRYGRMKKGANDKSEAAKSRCIPRYLPFAGTDLGAACKVQQLSWIDPICSSPIRKTRCEGARDFRSLNC